MKVTKIVLSILIMLHIFFLKFPDILKLIKRTALIVFYLEWK